LIQKFVEVGLDPKLVKSESRYSLNRTVLEAIETKIIDRPEKAFHDPLSVPRLVLSPAELTDYRVAGLPSQTFETFGKIAFVFVPLPSSSTCIFIFSNYLITGSFVDPHWFSCYLNPGF
jgi:hypothetical protein